MSTPVGGSSLSDLLTAVKNLVNAVANLNQAYSNVNGISTAEGLTQSTVVKTSAGRICSVSVVVAGTAPGMAYDSANQTPNSPLFVIPNQTGVFYVNMPTDSGILIVPGAGQKVTISWS